MFAPDWDDGCGHCSFWADNFNPNVGHLATRDVTRIAISRAPVSKLAAYRKRMGWTFPWVSAQHNTFNYDYRVSFTPHQQKTEGVYNYQTITTPPAVREGFSVFIKDHNANLFHTY